MGMHPGHPMAPIHAPMGLGSPAGLGAGEKPGMLGQPAATPAEKRSGGPMFLIVALLLLFALGAAGFYLFHTGRLQLPL
jgi:hypothetical protein